MITLTNQAGEPQPLDLEYISLAIFDLDDTLSTSNIEKPIIEARLTALFNQSPKLPEREFNTLIIHPEWRKQYLQALSSEGPLVFDTIIFQKLRSTYEAYTQNSLTEFIQAFHSLDKTIMIANQALKKATRDLNNFTPLLRSKIFQGLTPEQLQQLAAKTYQQTPVTIRTAVRDLLQAVQEANIPTTISTASNYDIAQAWIHAVNISPQIRLQATTYQKEHQERFTGRTTRPNIYENKIPHNHVGRILAVGDQANPPFGNDPLFQYTSNHDGTVIIVGQSHPASTQPQTHFRITA